jgi:hypothetical protein
LNLKASSIQISNHIFKIHNSAEFAKHNNPESTLISGHDYFGLFLDFRKIFPLNKEMVNLDRAEEKILVPSKDKKAEKAPDENEKPAAGKEKEDLV